MRIINVIGYSLAILFIIGVSSGKLAELINKIIKNARKDKEDERD